MNVAQMPERFHNANMANILVRNVPDDVHAALLRNAQDSNQSLQQYLTTQLTRLATRRPIHAVLDEIERQSGGSIGFEVAASELAAERSAQLSQHPDR